MNSGKPLRKNVGRGEDQQMFVLSNLAWVTSSSPKKSPDQGEEERSQMIGWDPQNGSGDSFPSAEIESKKKLVIGRGSWQQTHSHYSG